MNRTTRKAVKTAKNSTNHKAVKPEKKKAETFVGDIHFRSPHAEFPPDARTHVEKRLKKLTRFFNRILSASITYEEKRGQHEVSIHLDADGKGLHLNEKHHELRTAIDILMNRLEHQLARYKERMHRGGTRTDREALNASETPQEEDITTTPRLAEFKRATLKPMAVDEAILQMELSTQNFFVFRDVETDQFCVLYRRPDGHYGLVEMNM
jgi:putative sigma-54 modulation protein